MSNHVHLVVRAGNEPLWRLFKAVHVGYANWKNKRDNRLGPLFADRYKAVLVDADEYLLELIRYVHLNPVRAGVVARPEDSEWSSHRAYVGLQKPPAWLDTSEVLALFEDAGDTKAARTALAGFVADGLGGKRSPLLSGDKATDLAKVLAPAYGTARRPSDAIVGSEDFVAEVMGKLGVLSTTARLRTRESAARVRPSADRLVDWVCDVLEVDRLAFDDTPRARGPRYARYLLTRVWVSVYRGRRIDLARALKVNPEQITRWLARSIDNQDLLHNAYQSVIDGLEDLERRAEAERACVESVLPEKTGEKPRRISINLEMPED